MKTSCRPCGGRITQSAFKISIFSIIFTILCSQHSIAQNHLAEMMLKGPVRSLQETSYIATEKSGKVEAGKKGREWFTFDEYEKYDYTIVFNDKGNKAEESFFLPAGNLSYRSVYTYNEDNTLHKVTRYDKDNQFIEDIVYFYNESGVLETKFSTTEKEFHYFPILDWPEINYSWYYAYDHRGNVAAIDLGGRDGTLISTETYQYDESGKKIRLTRSNLSSGVISDVTYSHDITGNLTFSHDSISKSTTYYDYTYDANGNVIEETNLSMTDDNILIKKSKMETDQQGNWIAKIIYLNEKPKYVVKRRITYFTDPL